MAQYKLKSPHYIIGDKWLDTDTVVGDGTEHVIVSPTIEMEPLDDEAREMIAREEQRLADNQASMNPVEELPMQMDTFEERYVPGFNVPRAGLKGTKK